MSMAESFDDAVRRHDADLSERGLEIWVGSEPTFTDRSAQSPEWLRAAVGGDKESRARSLLASLRACMPGGVVLRCDGRRYPGESQPRWSLGLCRRRDGEPAWRGPPDPLPPAPPSGAGDAGADAPDVPATSESAPQDDGAPAALDPSLLAAFAAALTDNLRARGWTVAQAEPPCSADGSRVLELKGDEVEPCRIALRVEGDVPCPRVDLPSVRLPSTWLDLLAGAECAAIDCKLDALVVGGPAPPADAAVELTTITPDPAVIEVNSAPCATAEAFLEQSRRIYAAAAEAGLAPYRLYFNGTIADSGGGGQITIGGPSPQRSPFRRVPQLLPRLVRWFIAHPSLSYLFAHDFLGASGQSVRPDERGHAAFDELRLALCLLERDPAPTPERAWQSLAPFLSDIVGNLHRADINVEKLCNPHLPARGELGLVEFRSLRMQHTPERATALACLLRGVVAMLMRQTNTPPLIDWGRELHERFALPFFLEQDLEQVLAALRRSGFGLGPPIEAALRSDEFRRWAELALPGCVLEIRRAVEFWPLVGDAASPEQSGTSRLVDASTARVELRLRPRDESVDWRAWRIAVAGIDLPLRLERGPAGDCLVYGLRYRSFAPATGLHPALEPQAPVAITLSHAGLAQSFVVTLHEWRADGEAYDGLPADLDEARRRLAERVTVRTMAAAEGKSSIATDAAPGLSAYCLDLRYVERAAPPRNDADTRATASN